MGHGYSSDLRIRIHGEIERGSSPRAAARRFGVSASTGVRLAQRMTTAGSLEPARQGRPPGGGKLAPHAALVIGWVEAQGDITMPELAAKLKAARGVTVHPASLSRFLIAQGFSVKTLLATEIGRGDVARDRQIWRNNRQPRMRQEPDRLVFPDETATTTKMTRLRGRARPAAQGPGAVRPLGNPDLHRRFAL